MTVWVDTSTSLLLQVREEWKAPGGGVNRITTTYQAQANPTLDEAKFRFTPPES
jgi:outer membrane lipoprotein-sorting protein